MLYIFVQMALLIAFKQIIEIESDSTYEAFKVEFNKLMVGTLSLPINIPGTNYHRGFLVRSKIFDSFFQLGFLGFFV